MPTLNKIFVVIDPTTDQQPALVNAARIVGQNESLQLHVYEAVHNIGSNTNAEAFQRAELARHRAWLESLVEPMRSAGIAVNVEAEWTSHWRDAIAPAAARAKADLIVKSAGVHSGAGRRLLKTSDWTLLRHAHCPVYLIKRDKLDAGVTVLVALDISRENELHSKLNERVLEYGRAIVDNIPGSSLHAVNAYADNNRFIYQPDLAAKIGIPRTNAHTVEGSPEKVISEVAEKINAGIVIIGTAARDGIKATFIGNTAEKTLDALHTNILTVNAR